MSIYTVLSVHNLLYSYVSQWTCNMENLYYAAGHNSSSAQHALWNLMLFLHFWLDVNCVSLAVYLYYDCPQYGGLLCRGGEIKKEKLLRSDLSNETKDNKI